MYVGKLRGRKVAISEFREELSEMDIRELKLLAEFSHPNIVKFVSLVCRALLCLADFSVEYVYRKIIPKSRVCSSASYARTVICSIIL